MITAGQTYFSQNYQKVVFAAQTGTGNVYNNSDITGTFVWVIDLSGVSFDASDFVPFPGDGNF